MSESQAERLNILEYLSRDDKWYLGGGTGSVYAPKFPKWLNVPGFWDESYFADLRLERLFTLFVLDEEGRQINLQASDLLWQPHALTQSYEAGDLDVREEKCVTEEHAFVSRLTFTNPLETPRKLHLIQWGLQDRRHFPPDASMNALADAEVKPDLIRWTQRYQYAPRKTQSIPFVEQASHVPGEEIETEYVIGKLIEGEDGLFLELEGGREDRVLVPAGMAQSFFMKPGDTVLGIVQFAPQGDSVRVLQQPIAINGKEPKSGLEKSFTGDLHLALACNLPRVSYCLNLSEMTDLGANWWVSPFPEKFKDGQLANETKLDVGWNQFGNVHLAQHYVLEVPAKGSASAVFACAAHFDAELAERNVKTGVDQNVIDTSRERWTAFFKSVPYFECDNEYLTRYYWYRWFGLRLNAVDLNHEIYSHPCVMEGIDMFRCYITYSAQVHMREAAWMQDPALAMGSLLGEINNQSEDGAFKGHLYSLRPVRGFYHANWGANALHIYAIHSDKSFLEQIYEPLCRYADYFQRERDKENSHLYDIVNQDETGQEYMSRYLFVDEQADHWGQLQLKGVDSTYYIYELQKALSQMASLLEKPDDAQKWQQEAEQTKQAILTIQWDPELKFFCDVRPGDYARSPMKSACCFYPFWGDLTSEEHLPALYDHLLNPQEFWTEWPVPASSVDDPYFNPEGEWKEKRTNCPWNGRVWPMTNSHVAEALASASRRLAPDLRAKAAEFTEKFVRMMFYDRDPERPNCFEHYNPFTGTPCLYRGIDDYQHSWVVDLIMTQVVGALPSLENKLNIDPLPFDLGYFVCENLSYKGQTFKIEWQEDEGLRVWKNGELQASSPKRQAHEIAW